MAISDYSKLIPKITKWNVDQEKVFKERFTAVDKARVMTMKADKWLAAKRPQWAKMNKELLDKNKTWLLMAKEIARLQDELAGVKKKKETSKIKSLEIEIKKIDSRATKIVKDFTSIHDNLSKEDKELGKVLRTILSIGL